MACAPFAQVRRRRLGSHAGAMPGGDTARMPLSPSIITLRTSASDAPTSAILACGSLRADSRTHSAPARVLPKPRPAQTSHVCQSPAGGSCSGRAHSGQWKAMARASSCVSDAYQSNRAAGARERRAPSVSAVISGSRRRPRRPALAHRSRSGACGSLRACAPEPQTRPLRPAPGVSRVRRRWSRDVRPAVGWHWPRPACAPGPGRAGSTSISRCSYPS